MTDEANQSKLFNLLSESSQEKVVSIEKGLKDDGMSQKELYALFSNVLVQLDGSRSKVRFGC